MRKMRYLWLFAALLILMTSHFALANPTPLQELKREDRFEARIYTAKDGSTLSFRLLVPWNYDKNKSYPLVLMLHGIGERGNDNIAELHNDLSILASNEYRSKYPCFVIVPQCPLNDMWAPIINNAGKLSVLNKMTQASTNAMAVLNEIRREFNIDPKRIYITGLSMGGFGTWDILAHYPHLFAAAVPICGGGTPSKAKLFAQMPIWIWYGQIDNVVQPQLNIDMYNALKAAGGDPKITEVPNVGHDSWWNAYEDPETWVWLFSQELK